MFEYNFNESVSCADFIGGDQNVAYEVGPEDVERLIENILGFVEAGRRFLPAPDNREVLQVEHEGQKLAFYYGAVRRLET